MEDTTSQHKRSRSILRWLLPVGAIALAVVAFISVYASDSTRTQSPAVRRTPPASASLRGAYPVEKDGEGAPGQWIGNAADVTLVRVTGRNWLAFKGFSFHGARVLYFTTSDGSERFPVQVLSAPRWYVVGPLPNPSGSRLHVDVRPSAERGPGTDTRRLSVFMSSISVSPDGVLATAGRGFWPSEHDPRGARFNWLKRAGTVELVAADRSQPSAWVSFRAQSAADRELRVSVGDGSPTRRLVVAGGREAHSFSVGPIRLRDGRGTVSFLARPGPRRASKSDPRPVSVRVVELRATTHGAG
jgi:hypothetical protein